MPQKNSIWSHFLSPCDIFIAASLTSAPSVHFITASLPAHCVDVKMELQTVKMLVYVLILASVQKRRN